MRPKDTDKMANSVDPDQTAPLAVRSGSTLFAQKWLSENLIITRRPLPNKYTKRNGPSRTYSKGHVMWNSHELLRRVTTSLDSNCPVLLQKRARVNDLGVQD